MEPAPVGIKHNVGVDSCASSSSSAALVAHGRVVLSSRGASLLTEDSMAKSQDGCQSRGRDHFDRNERV